MKEQVKKVSQVSQVSQVSSENALWSDEIQGKRALSNFIYVIVYVCVVAGLITFYLSLD